MEKRTLYYNASIITGSTGRILIPDGYLLVEGNRIAAVGDGTDGLLPESDVRHNLCGRIIAPGMISSHCHFYGQFVRGMPLNRPISNWQQVLSRMWWKLDKKLDREQIYYSAMMGMVEGLKAGTTTYFDHHASPNFISGSLDVIEEAINLCGGRGCLAYEVTDRDGEERALLGIAENMRYIQKNREKNGRFKGIFGLHASYTLTEKTLERCAEAGGGLQTGFHIHMAEHPADVCDCFKQYDMHVVDRLLGHGILNEKTITAHNVHLNRPQFEILRQAGVTAAYNGQSNTNNAVGICPAASMMDAGVRVALGGDGYTYDLFTELGFAVILQRLREESCGTFPSGQVLDMVYTNNQRLAKGVFGYDIGELKAGAAADFLILDYDPPTPLHEGNVLAHMTSGFSGHVETVVVDGETVVSGHKAAKVDEAEVFAKCRESARRLWAELDND